MTSDSECSRVRQAVLAEVTEEALTVIAFNYLVVKSYLISWLTHDCQENMNNFQQLILFQSRLLELLDSLR